MKIEITWKFVLDLDEITKKLKENSVQAIKSCVSQSLYIRKLSK